MNEMQVYGTIKLLEMVIKQHLTGYVASSSHLVVEGTTNISFNIKNYRHSFVITQSFLIIVLSNSKSGLLFYPKNSFKFQSSSLLIFLLSIIRRPPVKNNKVFRSSGVN